jgi:hypothetical protein
LAAARPDRRWFTVRTLFAILAVVMAIPPLLVVSIALGPVALLIVWAILCVAPFLLVGWVVVRSYDARWRHTGGFR